MGNAGLVAPLEIDPRGPLLHRQVDDALLDKHCTLHQKNALVAFDPAGDLVGIERDRKGIAGNIVGQANAVPGQKSPGA
jgi:hypothetical protein